MNNPKNGFIQSSESSDFVFEAKVDPPISNDTNSQIAIHLRINRKDGMSVIDFGDVEKLEALERENYLSFDLAEDVHLESGDVYIPVAFHHYEHTYGLKPSLDILFEFKKFEPNEEVYFVYRDNLFGQGLVKIEFDKDLFKSCYVKE